MSISNLIKNKAKENAHNDESSTSKTEVNLKTNTTDPRKQKLDLTVPKYQSCEEDEDEIEE